MNRLTKVAVVAIALSTTAAPMLVQAQDRGHAYRQEHRQNSRDYRHNGRSNWGGDRYDGRQDHRPDRREDRHGYRNDRRDWRNDHSDRNNRDWWRGRSDFSGYDGPRAGYWYAPSYGYHQVEPRYSNYRWRTGGYLPDQYRNYYVRDPYVYGLREAPHGYRYVHAGNDILMIAVASGLIASVLSGVY
ncbi:RcnB family protein [Brevundimonas sp.]|uniref:RcnB family protein n=1 Tax=Brevundimonas sp. TaxID=1871086 RepID=UPI003568448C